MFILAGRTHSIIASERKKIKRTDEKGSDMKNWQSENSKVRSGALGLLKKPWWLCLSQEFTLCEPLNVNYLTL